MTTIDVRSKGADPASSDATAAIQAALDAAQAGDTVVIPTGCTFMVDPVKMLFVRSNTIFQIDGTLQAIPTTQAKYQIVAVDNVENVTILLNGKIVGERDKHGGDPTAQSGWGFGLCIMGGTNIIVRGGGSISNCWGDGILVYTNPKGVGASKNVLLAGITCSGNRRQGMSVIDVDGLAVTQCNFLRNGTGAGGTAPGAGVDLEPDDPSKQSIRNVRFSSCQFHDNAGAGLLISCPPSARSSISADGTNSFDEHAIDGTDDVVPFWAKWFYYVFRSYALYPTSINL